MTKTMLKHQVLSLWSDLLQPANRIKLSKICKSELFVQIMCLVLDWLKFDIVYKQSIATKRTKDGQLEGANVFSLTGLKTLNDTLPDMI